MIDGDSCYISYFYLYKQIWGEEKGWNNIIKKRKASIPIHSFRLELIECCDSSSIWFFFTHHIIIEPLYIIYIVLSIEDRTAYKNRDRCKNRDSKEDEVDLMMIYECLSFHIEHLSYNWSIITYWVLIKNPTRVFHEVKHSTIVRSTV